MNHEPRDRNERRLTGSATPEGTAHYRSRFPDADPEHFTDSCGLQIGSVGIGTYLGNADDRTDQRYTDSLRMAVGLGANVIDTAINYRFQRSERAVGTALRQLADDGFDRNEVVISTKAGFLSFDDTPPRDPRKYFLETYVDSGILAPQDIAGGIHAMTPKFLQSQIGTSLENLGLETIDILYLHNPETQLDEVDPAEFRLRLRRAFDCLEAEVESGRIRCYGTATWNGYRAPEGAPGHMSLEEVVQCARDVAGEAHNLKVIQLPFNPAMPEALTSENQTSGGRACSVLQAAADLGLTVMASASILQARLSRNLPDAFTRLLPELESDSQRAIQFVRSTPGVTTALVGMSNPDHVRENLRLIRHPRVPGETIRALVEAA